MTLSFAPILLAPYVGPGGPGPGRFAMDVGDLLAVLAVWSLPSAVFALCLGLALAPRLLPESRLLLGVLALLVGPFVVAFATDVAEHPIIPLSLAAGLALGHALGRRLGWPVAFRRLALAVEVGLLLFVLAVFGPLPLLQSLLVLPPLLLLAALTAALFGARELLAFARELAAPAPLDFLPPSSRRYGLPDPAVRTGMFGGRGA